MILLREIQETDLESLVKFSQIPGFINLPNDKDLLKEKISSSIKSFSNTETEFFEGKYLFVAEKLETKEIVGTSMIASQHGTVDSPHFYFEVGKEEKFSQTISTGFIHGTLKLKYDMNGPSEIGGLVINLDFRNSEARIGRQISFVRFLYLALNKRRFKRKLLAELLPPLNKKGQSPLWEAIGRRFTNMDYWEADQLCQKNKEFIFSLFPTGKIYTTFLSAEAKNAIGKVGKDTEPVLHMLTKIGFNYLNHVDPFDGGPHLTAEVEDLLPIKKVFNGKLGSPGDNTESSHEEFGILSKAHHTKSEFKAISVKVKIDSKNHSLILMPTEVSEVRTILGLNFGDPIAFMPYY